MGAVGIVYAPVKAPTAHTRYWPHVLITGELHYLDVRRGVDEVLTFARAARIPTPPADVSWDDGEDLKDVEAAVLSQAPTVGIPCLFLPGSAADAKSYEIWQRNLYPWLIAHRSLTLWRAPTGTVSRPEESGRDFWERVRPEVVAAADADVQKRYAPRIARLMERVAKAEEKKAAEQMKSRFRIVDSAIGVGVAIMNLVADATNPKRKRGTALRQATAATRVVAKTWQSQQGTERITAQAETASTQLEALHAEIEREHRVNVPTMASLAPLTVRLTRTKITLRPGVLAWLPREG